MKNVLSMLKAIPGLGGLLDKAPEAIQGFLDKLIEENRKSLDPLKSETQIFYVMLPDGKKKEYIISIVAADNSNTILRVIKCIALKDALSVIFNQEMS